MGHGGPRILKKCQAFSASLRAHEFAQQADASHPNPTMVREKPQSEAGGVVWG